MKDFFMGGVYKKSSSSAWLDDYEEELAIKKPKNHPKV
jgi:hypothetical protein